MRVPEYTPPQGGGAYHCSKGMSANSTPLADGPVETSWTQGFFPGLLWLMVERQRLLPSSVEASYSEEEIVHLARRFQEGFRHMAYPATNHDQGFRFQLSYGMCVSRPFILS